MALRDWLQKTPRKPENMPQGVPPKIAKTPFDPFGSTGGKLFSEKRVPSERITTGTIYQGKPTDEALEIAERIYNHLADMKRPCFEGTILAAAGGDVTYCRSILFRLVVEGFIEYRGGGAYQIPKDPPKKALRKDLKC